MCPFCIVIAIYKFCHITRVYEIMQRYEAMRKSIRKSRSASDKLYLPGVSGTSTLINTSLPSPSSALSATNLKRPKFIFAPLTTATNLRPALSRLFSVM